MVIQITKTDGSPAYEIRPYDNGLCWQIYKYRDHKDGTSGFEPTGNYPGSLDYALDLIAERIIKNATISTDLANSAKATRRALADWKVAVLGDIKTKAA